MRERRCTVRDAFYAADDKSTGHRTPEQCRDGRNVEGEWSARETAFARTLLKNQPAARD